MVGADQTKAGIVLLEYHRISWDFIEINIRISWDKQWDGDIYIYDNIYIYVVYIYEYNEIIQIMADVAT